MRTIFIVLCSMFTITSFAQTKLIAFKSHSGNMKNFSITMENKLFSDEGSNFGTPPYATMRNLDSVIYISPTVSVLVLKEYHYPWGGSKDSAKFIRMEKDTVRDSPIFSKKHSLDSIKTALQNSRYPYYDNPVSKVVFVGYDNKKIKEQKKDTLINNSQPKEKQVSPIITTGNDTGNNSPFDTAMLKALAGIFLLAILGGWLSAKFYNLRLQKA